MTARDDRAAPAPAGQPGTGTTRDERKALSKAERKAAFEIRRAAILAWRAAKAAEAAEAEQRAVAERAASRYPFNPLPPLFAGLVLLILGIEAAFQLGSRGIIGDAGALGWRVTAQRDWGFSATLFQSAMQTGRLWPDVLTRALSYPFIDVATTPVLMGSAILLAIGTSVARASGVLVQAAVLVAATLAGALAFGATVGSDVLLTGVFPAVYGLIGFHTWTLFAAATDRKGRLMAFRLVAFLIFLQVLGWVLAGGRTLIVADLAGFATGFVLAVLIGPGARARLARWLAMIRG
jgi:hypothetical protein